MSWEQELEEEEEEGGALIGVPASPGLASSLLPPGLWFALNPVGPVRQSPHSHLATISGQQNYLVQIDFQKTNKISNHRSGNKNLVADCNFKNPIEKVDLYFNKVREFFLARSETEIFIFVPQ